MSRLIKSLLRAWISADPIGTGLAASVVHQDTRTRHQISVGVFHLDVVNRGAVRAVMQRTVFIFAQQHD